MLRAITLGVALSLAGCATRERIPLLTGALGCYAGGEGGGTGLLVADPTYGTSFGGQPVMWPEGYSGRHAGSEIEVLDALGRVKATTGRIYHISFASAYGLDNGSGSLTSVGPANAYPAAVDCGYHHDFIDCTAAPTDQYCKQE